MKKCYCCGADVPDNAKFCPKCGKTMEITRDLIDRAEANDPDAQTELYERTYKTVYSRIRAKVPDEDTAMDIMQETYLRAFTGLNMLQKAETFPSWLLTIATRKVCDWYRKNGKENENVQMSGLEYENDDTIPEEDDLLEEPEYREDFSPDESLDRAETGRLLSEILNTLPEDQRIVLVMRYYDEMSLKEISEELGVNLSTVKTRLTAGKKKVEAKVLELEKSGTKLYSLGPVAFLVFLLHHAELFAPAISANAVIGLAAGGAAAGAAAHAAAGVTAKTAAGTAVKAAAGAAAKGIGIKIAAVAAAVVVGGGGVTAAVLTLDHDTDTAAAVSEQVDTDGQEDSGGQETPSETDPEAEVSVEPEPEPEKIIRTVTVTRDDGSPWEYYEYDRDGNVLCQVEQYLNYDYGYDESLYYRYDYTYDSSGNELSKTTYDSGGGTSSRYECTYDGSGNMLSITYYYDDGTVMRSEEYTYDGMGNKLTQKNYDSSGRVSYSWEYTYDGNGNMLTSLYKQSSGESLTTYTYDSEGKELTVTQYSSEDGSISHLAVDTYDEAGNLIAIDHTYDDGSSARSEYTYDSNGNKLTETNTFYNQDGTVSTQNGEEYIYDENGNVLTYKNIENGNVYYWQEFTYDGDGNMLTEIYYDADAAGGDGFYLQKVENEYDENGNLVTEKYSYDDNEQVYHYEYEYFD